MVGTILRKKRSATDKIRIRNSSANNVGRKPKEVDFSEAVEAIMKTRIDIEERIKKKVEEGLLASQKIDETVDKRRELEEQIKKLKAENERNNRMKFEKELEIEKFRLTLQKASEIRCLHDVPCAAPLLSHTHWLLSLLSSAYTSSFVLSSVRSNDVAAAIPSSPCRINAGDESHNWS